MMQITQTTYSPLLSNQESLQSSKDIQPAVNGTVTPVAQQPEALQSSSSFRSVDASSGNSQAGLEARERQQRSESSELKRDELKKEIKGAVEAEVEAQEQKQIQELAARDREVRQHEQNHAAVGGKYAGAPSYEFERGPDGRLYAVGGEVSIDTSPVPNDPEATLEKAEVIQRAALAVAEPSPQDRAVAAAAAAMAAEARAELASVEREETGESESSDQADSARREAQELRDKRSAEERKDRIEDQQELSEQRVEQLKDFNRQLQEVSERILEVNQRLIDAGVFNKLIPEGYIFDKNV